MTYYIDPQRGSDIDAGTRKEEPWRTFLPLNKLLLAAGDRVEIQPGVFKETLMPMGAGTAEQPIEIRFAPGSYDFYPADAVKLRLHISNSNDDPYTPKPVALLFQGIKHLNVTGNKADIYVHGKMIELMLDRAEDVTLSGLAFDYRRPLVSEFTVLDVAEHHADAQIQRDATYAIEAGKFVWVGEGWRSRGTSLNQECDPADDGRTWRCGSGPLSGVNRAEELAPFKVRFHFDRNPGFARGRVIQFREIHRDIVGGFVRNSRNIVMRDGAFHALGGMGIVHQFSENITYERTQFAPRPGSGRTTCGWADLLHFSGCRGQIVVDTVTFSGSHDDPINVHGTHLRIVGKPSDSQVLVRFMHPQTYGFQAFFPGDEIEFVDHVSLCPYAASRVAAAEMKGDKEMLLTIEKPVPAWKANDVVENATWTPAVKIRNCHISGDSCRGFLLTTRRPVLVESNTFVKTGMSAILIADDARSWFESGYVRDVTIRGNRFLACAEPVISIDPENGAKGKPVHESIRIEGNEFLLRGQAALSATSTKGLVFSRNRIRTCRQVPIAALVSLEDCPDATIEGNDTSVTGDNPGPGSAKCGRGSES